MHYIFSGTTNVDNTFILKSCPFHINPRWMNHIEYNIDKIGEKERAPSQSKHHDDMIVGYLMCNAI